MSHVTNPRLPLKLFRLSLAAAFLLCFVVVAAPAQTRANGNAAHSAPAAKADPSDEQPAFQEFKGVRIGMPAEEARKKLGSPTDKSDAQDFYLVSEKETIQVMYDAARKVSAIALIYMNAGEKAPTARAVMGSDLEAKADGSVYKVTRYPKAGYLVSYSRTAGDSPVISIMMQKMN
jgi:hypothetical protein